MATTSRSALPMFAVAGFSLVFTVATGLEWVGKPLRLVQLISIIGLGMFTGVLWMQAILLTRQNRDT